MTNHPFLNPHSSRSLLSHRPTNLSATKIWLAGALGTSLSTVGSAVVWLMCTQVFDITLTTTLRNTAYTLHLLPLLALSVFFGITATLILYGLGKIIDQPLRMFRLVSVLVFLAESFALLMLPLSPTLRLIGFVLCALQNTTIVTPLIRYTQE